MTIGLRLFISSAVFAITISVAYWTTSREVAGSFLLGVMAFALCFVAGYMIVAEREADLVGDEPDAAIADGASELVGTYTIRSPLPVGLAFAIASAGVGIVVSPTITVLALIAALVFGAFMIVQSR